VGRNPDGRPRFDLESDHAPHHPSLRRVSSPTEISAAYRHAALIRGWRRSPAADRRQRDPFSSQQNQLQAAAHRHAGEMASGFSVHPHSNDDIITALLMVSEVTPENGPLNVVPGSHQGPLWSHWQDDRFTGAVDRRG
jgi:ectoine hydroxylase-related dioxygenase (phytanoyl-CoA dioxygenase family)